MDRQQPPRLKGLKWYDSRPYTRAENVLMVIGWLVSALGIAVLIWSFF